MNLTNSKLSYAQNYNPYGINIGGSYLGSIYNPQLNGYLPNLITGSTSPTSINTGQMTGQTSLVSGFMQSSNFVSGSNGWQINSSGDAEFNSGVFRGDLKVTSTGTFGHITGGDITLDTSGFIRGGQTGFNSGSVPGFWMGYDTSGTPGYKLSIGNVSLGHGLTFDGTNLIIAGTTIFPGASFPWSQITDDNGLMPANNATVGATWGTNLGNIPSTLGAVSSSGLYLSSSYLGYYNGSSWMAYIDNLGRFQFKGSAGSSIDWNVTNPGTLTIKGSLITTTNTIGSTSVATIETGSNRAYTAINSSNNLITDVINTNLDTSSKYIKGQFTFQGSGAIQIGTSSNGISISPNGLYGVSGGSTKFSIDNNGNAYFNGTLGANAIYTGQLNANQINVGTLSGFTVIGGTVETSSSGSRVVMNGSSNDLSFYSGAGLSGSINGLYAGVGLGINASGILGFSVAGTPVAASSSSVFQFGIPIRLPTLSGPPGNHSSWIGTMYYDSSQQDLVFATITGWYKATATQVYIGS